MYIKINNQKQKIFGSTTGDDQKIQRIKQDGLP